MRQFKHTVRLSASAFMAALLVSACGGGGSPPTPVAGSSGFAVDDYLSGATVLCDSNGNGAADVGETTTKTDSTGFFKFTPVCTATIVVTGGTNIDTGLAFVGKMRAPAGSTVVTPLTTLLTEGMTNDQVTAALGLPAGTDLKNTDPARKADGAFVNPDLAKKTLVFQQLVQKTTEMLAGIAASGGEGAKSAIYGEVASAMAAILRGNPVLASGNTVDQAAIANLVKAAVQRVASSGVLSPEVKSGAQSVNADSIGQVIAGGLKAQSEAILNAVDATAVTAATKTAQMDSQLTTFIQTNKAQLGGPPSGATASLATTLTTAVASANAGGGGGGGNPVPPLPPGTVLLTFDESPAPAITGFGGAEGSSIELSPPAGGGTGKAARVLRAGGFDYAGAAITMAPIPFTATRKTLSARVYSPKAGIPIKIKVEFAPQQGTADASSTTAVVAGWQTLSWVLDVDLARSYTSLVVLPDIGTIAPNAGESYFFDNVVLAPAAGAPQVSCATNTHQCISFSESTIALLGFEGLVSAEVVDDPVAGASNKVGKVVKGPSGQPYAGFTLYTAGTVNPNPAVHSALSIDRVGLTNTNTSKIVTLRSFTPAAIGTIITLKLENAVDQGQNIAAQTVTTKQNEWEVLTFDFNNLTTGVFSAQTTYNAAVIFPAFSIPGPNAAPLAANTAFFFDELKYLVAVGGGGGGGGALTAPDTAAATPNKLAADVISIYSGAYTSTPGVDFNPNWGQSTVVTDFSAGGNATKKLATLNYQGIDFAGNPIDVSGMTKLHVDIWTPDVTSINIKLISAGPVEQGVTVMPTMAGWNTFDIDLSQYTTPNKAAIIQISFTGTPAGGTIYYDNIYFWKAPAATCGTNEPTCAPTTVVPGDAVKVYTEATVAAGFEPRPDWGQSTQYSEVTIANNKSLKYSNLNYEGINLNAVNVSAKGKVHLDIWSADVTSVRFFIISLNPTQDTSSYTINLTPGVWNSVDIDLSAFPTPNKAAIAQFKFDAPTPANGGTIYVDNIYFWGTGGAGQGGGGGGAALIYASNYTEQPTPWKSVEGGDAGRYIDGGVATLDWWSGLAAGDATPNYYFGYGINVNNKPWGFGAFVKAPLNGTAAVSSYANLKIAVWGNDQLVNTHPNFTVILQGPTINNCSAKLKGNIAVSAIGAQTYILPLSGFTLEAACGFATPAAALAAGVNEVHVQVLGANLQYTAGGDGNGNFPNGLNVGPISFIN